MQTIGVLGGFGPQATIEFEETVHDEARLVVTPHLNQGYPPMVTVYLRHAPVLLGDDERPVEPLTVDPRFLETAARLGAWADFLVVIANTPHLFLDEIREAAACDVLSMVDVVVEDLSRREAGKVGLLGLGVPQAYVDRFEQEGIEFVVAPPEIREPLDDAIFRLLEGTTTESGREAARAAVAAVREAGASVTILGCTEIPLLLGAEADEPDLVNPTRLLARAAVRRAVG
jgi:aspartate racemase